MSHELDLKKYSVRTDLAIEANERKPDVPGLHTEHFDEAGVKITKMTIDSQAAAVIRKKEGAYLTLKQRTCEQAIRLLRNALKNCLQNTSPPF
ncbi:hypothetical protein NBRC111894_1894 [Sporolactobacillus inulinus]|uniref:Uncharacterized protein n=1 Tax=Sporolactobacillus inulinus TaxID=2078 RepID=A0A4Y1ZBE7_9BACL|nr:hypothetical protein NBRC111894_1894 [Sporolactobacillus inulinus]